MEDLDTLTFTGTATLKIENDGTYKVPMHYILMVAPGQDMFYARFVGGVVLRFICDRVASDIMGGNVR